MAIIFTKYADETETDIRFFKFAYQFWLKEKTQESDVNITLGMMNLSKDKYASGFSIFFPFKVSDIQNISSTLLDDNCLLNSARGGYEYPRDDSNNMPKFDGVPSVRVEQIHKIDLNNILFDKLHISQLNIKFKNDIKPNEKIAVRFVFKTDGVITKLEDTSISFLCKIFDPLFVEQFIHDNNLESREIKLQCYYDWSKKSGGFDPILFYPSDYELREVTKQYDSIVDRPDLHYNYLGNKVNERYKKATWRAWQILGRTKDDNVVGYRNNIQWFCTLQNSKALNNIVDSLRSEINTMNNQLIKQKQKSNIFTILSIILGVISIILAILLALFN